MQLNELRRMLARGMGDPDGVVLEITYVSKNGQRTERTISPIRFVSKDIVLALCLGRAEPRQFALSRIHDARLTSAADVLMPTTIVEGVTF